ncbi:MAG: DNA-formamidopyrimidine glycosylase [Cyanobacteria bacterium]|nr:DNA-formamidopyrimidine glycosylase [Cyanobacteriota bacterium]MDW8201276.1 DNA-formamidopyrimidine glycosylase [Cyanobacteriota bacterium SKYGB_h_bin112]
MPELPEVETVRRGLNQTTLHQPLQGGEVLLARTIAYPIAHSTGLDDLHGKQITTWHRRGKYLLAELLNTSTGSSRLAGWLGVHLRMTGQLLWLCRDEPVHKHTRVRLFFPQRQELRFVDQRTFGQLWIVPANMPPEQAIPGLQRLGPEPLSPDFSVAYLAAQVKGRQRSIKSALLDQTLVAGVGNIYADEALFLSGIRPYSPCRALSDDQVQRLHEAVVTVLQAAIAAGGTTFSNFLSVYGVNGNYSRAAWVYDRENQPCRVCGTSIQRIKLAGRSAHYCPQCQL